MSLKEAVFPLRIVHTLPLAPQRPILFLQMSICSCHHSPELLALPPTLATLSA